MAIHAVVDDGTLASEFVKSSLLEEEQRMHDRVLMFLSNDSAVVNSTFKNQSNPSAIDCSYCKQRRHTEPICWTKYPPLKQINWSMVAYFHNTSAGGDKDKYDCQFCHISFHPNLITSTPSQEQLGHQLHSHSVHDSRWLIIVGLRRN